MAALRSFGAQAAIAAWLVSAPLSAHAQQTPDESGDLGAVPDQEAGGGYAWEEGGDLPPVASSAAHRDAFVWGTIGAGGTMRLYYDPDLLHQDIAAPVYLQLRGAYFFDGEGDLQHGVGLGIATNLTPDPTDLAVADGFYELGQWTFAPSYFLRVWIDDALQVQAHVGLPLGLSGAYQTVGVELGGGVQYKFLSGFGIYADVLFSTYFALFAQPMLSADLGLVFDYEVLP